MVRSGGRSSAPHMKQMYAKNTASPMAVAVNAELRLSHHAMYAPPAHITTATMAKYMKLFHSMALVFGFVTLEKHQKCSSKHHKYAGIDSRQPWVLYEFENADA